jgi:hypothetical protein
MDLSFKVLYEQWANVRMWFKKQPLWVVRRYFGDQIGLYFTWLGFYTRCLFPAAILGVMTFIFGIYFIYSGDSEPRYVMHYGHTFLINEIQQSTSISERDKGFMKRTIC